MPESYRDRLADLAESLRQDDRFTDVVFEPGGELAESVVERVRSELQIELPESLLSVYRAMNGLSLTWVAPQAASEPITGDTWILPLEEAFGGPRGMQEKTWDSRVFEDVLWFDDYPAKVKKFLKSARRFQPFRGYSAEVVLKFGDVSSEPELWLVQGEDLYRLHCELESYWELLVETRGTGYWQYHLLSSEDEAVLNLDLPYREQVLLLFPDARIEQLRPPEG